MCKGAQFGRPGGYFLPGRLSRLQDLYDLVTPNCCLPTEGRDAGSVPEENRLAQATKKVRVFELAKTLGMETKAVLEYYPKEKVHQVQSVGSPARVLYQLLSVVAPLQDQHYTGLLG